MSDNLIALEEAARQLTIMMKLVKVFESGVITNIEDLNLDLSEAQIATLVGNFATARTTCIAELNKVTSAPQE